MKVWIAFLLLSFLSGAYATRTGRKERASLVLAGCAMVAGLFMFERFA